MILTSTTTFADQETPEARPLPQIRPCQTLIGLWRCTWNDGAVTMDTYTRTFDGLVDLTSVDLGETNTVVFDGKDNPTTNTIEGVKNAVVNSTLSCNGNIFSGVVTLKFNHEGQAGKLVVNMTEGLVEGSKMSMKQITQNYQVVDGVDVPFNEPIINSLNCEKTTEQLSK